MPIDPQKDRVMINEQIRKAGVEQGIRSIVIVPSMIYGTALGLPRESVHLPLIIRKSKEMGAGVYIGKGVNRWSNVHIKDLAKLYLLAVEKAPSASYFYAENGEESFGQLAKFVSRALGYGGQTVSWSFDEAVGELGGIRTVCTRYQQPGSCCSCPESTWLEAGGRIDPILDFPEREVSKRLMLEA
ncbi:NAD-dependent epimerase/dehydratase family protein [Paenibacillus sp. V4I7]|uniref:NAD-dependent epimerase/dehydratase family protein n=1 Tax=Paenibacillus sp. V4I7 TaxID=3042307 RepID=UPI0027886E72|nr:NAD-dependent epimerase/dehydratase family protein [Paenibacillus sp. V4I7]MDQ0899043.1 nucleoside-diphosphate-sugar epimerase [Paenibacillus sp. V4I7]